METETDPFERTIYFQGLPLPATMVHVDHLGMYDTVPDFPEDTSEWLWRFPICFGQVKTDFSSSVLHHCGAAQRLSLLHRDPLLAYLARVFPEHEPVSVFDAWQEGFAIILRAARTVERCFWFAPLNPAESQTIVPVEEQLRRLNLAITNAGHA